MRIAVLLIGAMLFMGCDDFKNDLKKCRDATEQEHRLYELDMQKRTLLLQIEVRKLQEEATKGEIEGK